MATLKVFAKKADRKTILEQAKLVGDYDAFVVVDAAAAAAKALTRSFPVEDISDQYRIPLGGAERDPVAKPPGASRGRGAAPLDTGPHHYVVQFIGPVKPAWTTALKRTGATIRQPFGGFAYVVRADDAALEKLRALEMIRWIGHLPHADRVSPELGGTSPRAAKTPLPRRRVVPDTLVTEVFGAEDVARIAKAAGTLGFAVLHADKSACTITLENAGTASEKREKIRALSAVHGVRLIRERVLRRTSNNVATGLMDNTFAATKPTGLKLTGAGEIVAVCDTGFDSGDAAAIHPDFAGRVVAIKSYPIGPEWKSFITNPGGNDGAADLDSGHGTHVAGSVLGDGTASSSGPDLIRGHAFKARLVFQAIEQEMKWKPSAPAELRSERYLLSGIPSDLTPLFRFAFDQGARIHSNSWGGGDAGAYDAQCEQFDDFVWTHKDFCFVIAAGNDGTDNDGDGKINPTSVTSPGTAKNCITVGACENLRPAFNANRYGDAWPDDYPVAPFKNDPMANNPKQVVPFSSRGPTNDGRVKPDVVAPGTYILSTRSRHIAPNNFAWAAYPPNKLYFHMGGTSMATPLTSGALALIREFLRTERSVTNPSAALLKALLIAGAKRLPGTGQAGDVLDNAQGYGRVDLDRSLKSVLMSVEGAALATGQLASHSLAVASTGKTLRIVLAYSDFPGERLINNLNLIVVDPKGRQYVGNQRRIAGATLAMDASNNVELVQVSKAKKGTWTIDVVASNVAQGPQDFALAVVAV